MEGTATNSAKSKRDEREGNEPRVMIGWATERVVFFYSPYYINICTFGDKKVKRSHPPGGKSTLMFWC